MYAYIHTLTRTQTHTHAHTHTHTHIHTCVCRCFGGCEHVHVWVCVCVVQFIVPPSGFVCALSTLLCCALVQIVTQHNKLHKTHIQNTHADCCAPSRVCVFCVVCCAVFCAGYCASLRVCVRFVQVVVLWCMLIVVRRLIVVLPPARCGGIISTASHVHTIPSYTSDGASESVATGWGRE